MGAAVTFKSGSVDRLDTNVMFRVDFLNSHSFMKKKSVWKKI